MNVLKFPASVIADLTLEGIQRLRKLAGWILERLSELTEKALRLVLGCDSPCKVTLEAIEKYFKSMLAEHALPIQKTHDLTILLCQLIPIDNGLRSLQRGLKAVSRYAVEYRYPGMNTTLRQARAAYQRALMIRSEIRRRLGLPVK